VRRAAIPRITAVCVNVTHSLGRRYGPTSYKREVTLNRFSMTDEEPAPRLLHLGHALEQRTLRVLVEIDDELRKKNNSKGPFIGQGSNRFNCCVMSVLSSADASQ